MLVKFNNFQLSSLCAIVPKNILAVDNISGLPANYAKRYIKHVGFEQFHIADADKTTADYCVRAAEIMLQRLSLDAKIIDAVVFVSQTPDYIMPATSIILQDRLKLRQDVLAFDINHGCPGFIYGLFQAASLINAGLENILLCVGDTATRYVNDEDFSTRLIFGDSASVALIQSGMQDIAFSFTTNGSLYNALGVRDGGMRHMLTPQSFITHSDSFGNIHSDYQLHMDGTTILKFSLEVVPALINNIFDGIGIHKDSVDMFVLHQANKIIVQSIAEKMKIDVDKIPFVAKNFGNTSGGSIPLALTNIFSGNSKQRQRVILCGFGIGLAAAVACLSLQNTAIMPLIEM